MAGYARIDRTGPFLLAFTAPAAQGARANLSLWQSTDAGATWSSPALSIWPGPAAYSDALQVGDGVLGVIFEGGVEEFAEGIFFTTVTLPVTAVGAPSRQNVSVYNTFYGAKDNCPPGGDIAHPVIHKLAGGNGTYSNPITFAGATAALPVGSIVYSWQLQKYFILEDDCEECANDWKKSKKWHFDVWMGPDQVTPGPNLIACENALTVDKAVFELSPLSSYDVDTTPLFDGATLQCIDPNAPPCTDHSDACGNFCEIPKSGTCDDIAAELLMNVTRFHELNKKLSCAGELKRGTNVCMGGNCGD